MKTKLLSLIGVLAIGACIIHASQTESPKMNGKLKVTTLSPEEIRYTGKPYIKELGAYAFNCRNYDPQVNRWTTIDPSGFPDGANNRIYAPVPTYALDTLGLEVINTVGDAIRWYNIGQGGNATAGSQIIDGIKASGDYLTQITAGLEMSINIKLNNVDKSAGSGTITGSGYRGLDYGSVLGSFQLNINYSSQWTASAWSNGARSVTSSVTLQLWINDQYDFTPNSTYSAYQNLTREDIPGWIAENSYPGEGCSYWIQANFTDTINGTGYQNE